MNAESFLVLLFLAGFASPGGRATVTYKPTPLEGDGQGCPSDENKAQVIENIHNLIEDNIETESTPETRLLTELNTAVETLAELRQEVADLSNTSQIVNGTLAELRQEVADLSNTSQIFSTVLGGLKEEIPAASCRHIFENRPDLPSGNYWIRSSNGTAVQLYCDMARQCCNGTTGGWTRVAYFDMTDPNQQCPPAWNLITSPRRTCGRTSPGCESATFPTNGITYSRVCGRVRAYQVGQPDAFLSYNDYGTSIESYVDGVSITHGSPRQHVWTFAAARIEQYAGSFALICPCTNPNAENFEIPPFVGNDYFCETAADTSASQGIFFPDDILWDGEDCGPTSTCCELNNPPWFCKQLPTPINDDIEVRICANHFIYDEDIAIEQIEIYIF